MLKQLENILKTEIDPAFTQRARYIFKSIEVSKPKYILDAGCGRGFYSHMIAFFPFVNKIYGVDINKKYLQVAQTHCTDKKIILKKSSIYTLPFADNYFDCIIFSEVLEHLSDEKKALTELNRVLKKGGELILTVPNAHYPFFWDPLNWTLEKMIKKHIPKHIWWLAGIWADHERLYSKKSLISLLKKHHFKIREIKESVHWCWPFSHFILYGLGKNIVEKFKINDFNRFNFSEKNSLFSEFISFCFKLPSNLFDMSLQTKTSSNIIIKMNK